MKMRNLRSQRASIGNRVGRTRSSGAWIGWSRLLVPETTEVGFDPHFEPLGEVRLDDETFVFGSCEVTAKMADGTAVRRFWLGSKSRCLMNRIGYIRPS